MFFSWRHDDNTCCLRAKEGASELRYPLFDPDETDDTKRDRARVDSYAAAAGDFTSSVDDNQSRLFIDTAQSARSQFGEKTSFRGCPLRVNSRSISRRRRRRGEVELPVHFAVPTAPTSTLLPVVWQRFNPTPCFKSAADRDRDRMLEGTCQ